MRVTVASEGEELIRAESTIRPQMTLTWLLLPHILPRLKAHQLHKDALTGILFPSLTVQFIVACKAQCRAELSKWLKVRAAST